MTTTLWTSASHVLSAYLVGFTSAYFLIMGYQILCLWPNRGERLSKLLGCFFIYFSFAYGKDVLLSVPGMYRATILDAVELLDGWAAVWFACFVFEIARPGWVTLRHVLWLVAPHACLTALCCIWHSEAMMMVWEVYLGIYGLAVLFVGYRRARTYMDYVKANYSNIDNKDISWVGYVYLMMFLTQLLWLLASVTAHALADCLYYALSVVFWQVVVVRCRRLRPVQLEALPPKAAASERTYPFAEALEAAMRQERLYLNPDLSLSDLATRLGTNRTYLSQYFATVEGATFYDYVNRLRVRHATRLIAENAGRYTLDHIAGQSGFNSLSTFRRAFRKFMGVNPGTYRPTDNGTAEE